MHSSEKILLEYLRSHVQGSIACKHRANWSMVMALPTQRWKPPSKQVALFGVKLLVDLPPLPLLFLGLDIEHSISWTV